MNGTLTTASSAFVVHWLFDKIVSFEEIKKVDRGESRDSVVQMWNGMQ